ncbi:Cloroperoxidase, partial [Athelia psychrophila]
MPPKLDLIREFRWAALLLIPLRVFQVCAVTTLMLIWTKLFGRAEKMIESHDPHRHVYRPPIKPCPGVTGDVRSPCPALNTLANHGFLPRSGRNIRPHTFIHGLQAGYNISYPLAAFLTWGSFMLLGQWNKVSLGDLARHGCVEHDGSLGHRDAPPDAEYAPSSWDAEYVQRLLDHSADGAGLRLRDIALARVKREAEYPTPMDALHAEIARGEMGMVLALFGRW